MSGRPCAACLSVYGPVQGTTTRRLRLSPLGLWSFLLDLGPLPPETQRTSRCRRDVERAANHWPAKDHPLEIGDSIEGEYVDKYENIGTYKSNVWVIDVNGERVGVWGSTVIDSNMEKLAIGARVGFEYAGLRQGKGGEYKDFRVGVVDDTFGEPEQPVEAPNPL